MSFAIVLAMLLIPGWALVQAQDHGSIAGNPYLTPQDAAVGAKSFRSQCAACHGLDASGGAVGPSLSNGSFKNGGSDDALFRTITAGVPGTAMLGFKLNGLGVWQIVTYIRSVNITKAADRAGGNAAKGAALFNTNGCGGCHTNGSGGGFAGPDLSSVGARRSLEQLKSSVIEPDADVESEYWSVRARTKGGETVSGIRMNEDMDSLQIRDACGSLRTLRKGDLASLEVIRKSPMPAFKTKLTTTELQDMLAYLASLRGQSTSEESSK